MFNGDTDKDWEKFGVDNPYFGVLSHDKFRSSNLTDENKEEFFMSGRNYIDSVLKKIRQHIDQNFTIKKALDFGVWSWKTSYSASKCCTRGYWY